MTAATASPKAKPTPAIPPAGNSVADDQERLAKLRAERLATAVESVRDYVRLKAVDETAEIEVLQELDEALELLKFPREKLPALVELQKRIDAGRNLLDSHDEDSTRLAQVARDAHAAFDAAQLALNAARGAWRAAQHAQTNHAGEVSELMRDSRACPLLFGTIEQALAELFPAPVDPRAALTGRSPNNQPQFKCN